MKRTVLTTLVVCLFATAFAKADGLCTNWSTVGEPAPMGTVDTSAYPDFSPRSAILSNGTVAYLVGATFGDEPWTASLAVLDMSDPLAPVVADMLPLPYATNLHTTKLAMDENELIVRHSNGIWFFDVSNPLHPAASGMASLSAFGFDSDIVDAHGDVLFGIRRERRLVLDPPYFETRLVTEIVSFDISEPSTPTELGRVEVPMLEEQHWVDLEFRSGYLFFVGGTDLLTVVSAQDPSAMTVVASVSRPDSSLLSSRHLDIVGDLAFIQHANPVNGSDHARLAIVDVTDPARPQTLSEGIFQDGMQYFSGFDGNLLYTTWSLHGAYVDGFQAVVHDLSDPSFPSELGRGNVTLGLGIAGVPQWFVGTSLVYTPASGGIHVLPPHCFHSVGLGDVDPEDTPPARAPEVSVAVSPNPFNPIAEIEFTTNRDGWARLEVVSLSGRRVATLFDGLVEAGAHRAIWRGRDGSDNSVAGGVYAFRLTTEGRVTSTRGTLLK